MYRILIFGTGQYYQKRKEKVLNDEVIGFLDNDENKQHKILEGRYIYSPDEIRELEFDYVLLMSKSSISMKQQLLDMGVKEESIIDYACYYKIKPFTEIKVFCSDNQNEIVEQEKLVLLISHELSNTGAPIVLYYMAKLLHKNGYYPVIISGTEGVLQKTILYDRIPLIISENVNNFLIKMLLRKAIMTICNTLETGYLVEDCACLCKKVVWWLHEGEASYREMTMAYCKKNFMPNVRILAVSELTKKTFCKYTLEDRNIKVFPYGIPDKGNKRKKIGNKIKFFLAGTISKRKGQDIMVEAIQLLTNEELERSEFIFAGAIWEKDVYEKIQRCTLSQVSYKGQLTISEMQELYEDIDIVVCPSREDPLPVVLTEGMMNAKACIMSDNTGMALLIKDKKQGIICKAGNVDSLVEQIRWVIHNTDKVEDIMKNGRKFYEENFTMRAFERRILDIFDE